MSSTNTESFKSELKELLAKYHAYIGFACDSCSDTHGVTGEKIIVGFDGGIDEATLARGWTVDDRDL